MYEGAVGLIHGAECHSMDRLQDKAIDLERLEHYFGREQIQTIVEHSKAIERAEIEAGKGVRTIECGAWRLSCSLFYGGKVKGKGVYLGKKILNFTENIFVYKYE